MDIEQILTIDLPVKAHEIHGSKDPHDPYAGIDFPTIIARYMDKERNYYANGVMYNKSITVLNVEPGIKDGGILNDEMLFKVTFSACFHIYLIGYRYEDTVVESNSVFARVNSNHPAYNVKVVGKVLPHLNDRITFDVQFIASQYSTDRIEVVCKLDKILKEPKTAPIPQYWLNGPRNVVLGPNGNQIMQDLGIGGVIQSDAFLPLYIDTYDPNCAVGSSVILRDTRRDNIAQLFAVTYEFKEYVIYVYRCPDKLVRPS